MDNLLCIIPARGGSKRIPRKNIKNFLGKPIISYSIESALKSDIFDEVMVSTDDKEIADIALKYGASLPFMRSLDMANDYATTVDVLKEVLSEYEKLGRVFKYACCIYPTAPFVNASILQNSFIQLKENSFDSVFPVLRYGFPIQRAMRASADGKVNMIYPEHMSSRSQDLEPSFHDAGQFYFFKAEILKSVVGLWTTNTGYIEVDELKAQDIDTITDWKLAELKYRLIYE